MKYITLDLQMFAEGEGESAAPEASTDAGSAPAAEGDVSAPVVQGDTLGDGTKVQSARVAAALERQMKKHPNLRGVYNRQDAPDAVQPAAAPQERSIEERWEEVKKGEFADLYGNDVRKAVTERFKNQTDANEKLNAMEPMLKVLRERAGVETNEDLIKRVMDDDSLYEEAANEAGMTVPAYKQFMQLKAERDAAEEREKQTMQQQMLINHARSLAQQSEKFRETFPNFNLSEELKNPQFARLTSPEIRMSVEDAYYAIHHKEIGPQMMAYGMNRARQQMGQTLQAQQKRPTEGAMRQQGNAAAEVKVNPARLQRPEREEIKRRVRMGEKISFD